MPLAPNVDNLLYGAGQVLFKPSGESGYLHLGRIPDFGITVAVEKDEHYNIMDGSAVKDKDRVKKKSAKSTMVLEEISPENINLAFMGDGVAQTSQSAGALDGQQVTTVSDRYVDLGAVDLSYLKLSHGTVTGGPFDAGETVTGGTSGATAKVAWPGTSHLELINVVGTFQAGETITGGTSAATASVSGTETMKDVVVTDHATTPTTRYTLGTDYSVVPFGGLIRELSGGSIASNTCYVSAIRPAKTFDTINALVNSSVEGELLFIGTPDDGPKKRVQGWKTSLTITGEVKYLQAEGNANISMEAEYLDDSTNHPNNPFFKEITVA